MKYELILFDADETLFDFAQSQNFALEKNIESFQIEVSYEDVLEVYNPINRDIWKEFEAGLITADALKIERFRRLFEALKLHIDPEAFAKSYLLHLSKASFIYDGVEALLETLSANHRMAIVTNGLSIVQNGRIRQSEIAHYFDEIIISEEINVAKPDPKIFEYTLGMLKHTNLESVLMVGDNLSSDIQGGIDFGIDTCWLNAKNVCLDTAVSPTYEIQNLEELKRILNV